ncbi:MAG: hypothetical protein DRN96_03480 [Thermoproteota archaeon]|nr:MAG: hypothetical protein DRN96_03480 [Candidatus Korarchaeota archaeon]
MAKVLMLVLLAFTGFLPQQAEATIPELKVELLVPPDGPVTMVVSGSVVNSGGSPIKSVVFPVIPREAHRKYRVSEAFPEPAGGEQKYTVEILSNTSGFRDSVAVVFKQEIPPGSSEQFKFKVIVFAYRRNVKIGVLEGEKFYLSYEFFCPNASVDSVLIKVILPEGYIAKQIVEALPVYFPTPNRTALNIWSGEMTIEWSFSKLAPGQRISVSASVVASESSRVPMLAVVAVLIVGGGASVAAVAFMRARRRARLPKINSMDLLTNDERAILRVILDAGGSMLQKELPEATGLSKAKVSRVLKVLEEKGLVVKKPQGKTNIIVLSKSVAGLFQEPS